MPMHPLTPTQVLQRKRTKLLRHESWKRLLISLLCTFLITLLSFAVVFGLAFVRGDSMRPAYQAKDFILFSRIGDYRRGNVVILRAESTYTQKYLKRIVALPGDTVDVNKEGRVLINGEVLEEAYAIGLTQKGSELRFPLSLKKDEFFVLGDNREHSSDSRSFGTVAGNQIDGKVLVLLRACNSGAG